MIIITEADVSFKICLFGEGGVGKTSLVRKYLTGVFELDTKMTIGASLFVKYLAIENLRIALQIWDFGGEDKFKVLLPVYSFESHAGIFMFDLSRVSTIHKINEWLEMFNKGIGKDKLKVAIYMVGGKSDLEEKRAIPLALAESIARSNNIQEYFESSSKTGENVDNIFLIITQKLLKDYGKISE